MISNAEGPRFFVLINKEEQPIEELVVTVYREAAGVLLPPSYVADPRALAADDMAVLWPRELKDSNGNGSALRTGVLHVTGRVGESTKGVLVPFGDGCPDSSPTGATWAFDDSRTSERHELRMCRE